eukprot:6853325-Prymnesium_polylepis.2
MGRDSRRRRRGMHLAVAQHVPACPWPHDTLPARKACTVDPSGLGLRCVSVLAGGFYCILASRFQTADGPRIYLQLIKYCTGYGPFGDGGWRHLARG